MFFALVRIWFFLVSRVAPRWSARAAHYLFRAPPKPVLTPDQRALLPLADEIVATGETRTAQNLGRDIVGRFFATCHNRRGCIALTHGWMSSSRFMMAYVEPLTDAGFDVIAFDAPGHGASGGKLTTGRDSAGAFHAVVEVFADRLPMGVTGFIGHSFGGAVAAFCGWLPHEKIDLTKDGVVLIGVPDELSYITGEFAAAICLGARAQALFEDEVTSELGLSMEELKGSNLFSTTRPRMMALHDPDDDEVAFEQGALYARLGPQVEIRPISGVGHRDIIADETAVDIAVGFFRDRNQTGQSN